MAHRVALDGVQLDEIDDRIMIHRVETGDGRPSISTVGFPGDGSRVTNISRASLDIVVKFYIRLKKRRMEEREELLEKINAWACAGGKLTVNTKSERFIQVFMAQGAVAGDPWEWTKEYQIVFRACGVPYWQQLNPNTVMRQNVTTGSIVIGVGGSAQTALDVIFKNTSQSAISTFSISTGESALSFTGLALAAGETLVIDHKDNGKKNVLRIGILNTAGVRRSVMDKRAGDDDLYVLPGTHTVAITAGGAGQITVSSCGRFI